VTVFPRTYETVKEHLAEDAIVVCQGKIEDRGDSFGMILDEVMQVEDAIGKFQGALVVKIDLTDRPRLPELKQLFAEYEGGSGLFLEVEGSDSLRRRVRVTQKGVHIDAELLRRVDGVLGPGRTSLARL
jgi:DNA polymerase III alpha subunit